MIRSRSLLRLAAVGLPLLGVLALTVSTHRSAAHAEPAPKLPTAEQMSAFRTKVRYTPQTFEMKVGPQVKVGGRLLVCTLTFPSPYKSVAPDPNDTVRGKLLHLAEPEKAAVIVIGGWRRDPLTPRLAMLLAETGVQVVYLQIPFQERRTPKGQWPGALTFSADLKQNIATFEQISLDIGRAREWLIRVRKIDPKRVGIMGTSLGGFAAATLYGMSDDFHCAGIMLAGANVADVVFNGNRLTQRIRAELLKQGLDKETVSKRLALLEPITWADKKRKDGLFLLAAENDTVVPLASVNALAKAYGGATVSVIPDVAHIAPQAVQEHFPKVAAHFAKILAPDRKKTATPGSKPKQDPPKKTDPDAPATK